MLTGATKMSMQHLKKLYDIAKEDGLKEALKYDLHETKQRHAVPAFFIGMLIDDLFYRREPVPRDTHTEEEVISSNEKGLSSSEDSRVKIVRYERIPFWR